MAVAHFGYIKMIMLDNILNLYELHAQIIILSVAIINLTVTIIIALTVYRLNKSSNVNERKMDFYNKACYDLWENRPTKVLVELKDMKKIMETAKFIERHKNICISDGIWEDIVDGVCYIGSGSEFPPEKEYNQKLSEEAYDKADKYATEIVYILCEMQKKYKKKFYN